MPISIAQMEAFTTEMQKNTFGLEGIILADENKTIYEHRFYGGSPRNIYSHTKSFMSSAVGMAIAEGKLSLDDKLCEFFPEYVPDNHQKALEEIKLRHLLVMSSGFGAPYLMSADRRAGTGLPDYLAYMLSREVTCTPGEKFLYSTADSHLAACMVEKAVGKKIDLYLYEKMFAPMGMGYPLWEKDPCGHPNGGGGLHLTLENQAKLGVLYLNDGKWNGEQIVPHEWIAQASRKQIDTDIDLPAWHNGYGYQFWIMPDGISYRADGAYGQITIVMPEQGLVLALQTAESGTFDEVRARINEFLLNIG